MDKDDKRFGGRCSGEYGAFKKKAAKVPGTAGGFETVEQFLARGGKTTICEPYGEGGTMSWAMDGGKATKVAL